MIYEILAVIAIIIAGIIVWGKSHSNTKPTFLTFLIVFGIIYILMLVGYWITKWLIT